MADVLPTLGVMKHTPVLQFNLLQHRIGNVSVLVERHGPSLPNREITISGAKPVRISRDAVLVQRAVLAFGESHFQFDCGVGLRWLPKRADYREPLTDGLAGDDSPSRDRCDPDQVGAEHVVVLDVEVDERDRVRQRDPEMLVPHGVLAVGDDARASHRGPAETDGDVRVAGNDLPVMRTRPLRGLWREGGGESLEGGEDSAETLRQQIHIRQTPSLYDFQIEVAMKAHHRLGILLRH